MEVSPRVVRRNIVIALLLILGMLAGVITWMVPEAMRLKRDRDLRVAAKSGLGAMVRLPGGAFTMGMNDGRPEERPLHDVRVNSFWMDATEVTNAQFERFVNATQYVTTAERLPLADAKHPAAGSWCFQQSPANDRAKRETWAVWVPGANWRHPQGPGSDIKGKERFPVVHVSYDDAIAYCKWAGKRLPTEAEWEYAARGGVVLSNYPWGMNITPNGAYAANGWQGPLSGGPDSLRDGFEFLAPTASFPANNYGLHDMAGNVAEWCADWFSSTYYEEIRPNPDRSAHKNPKGPETSVDPQEPGVWKRVVRGGSFLSDEAGLRTASRGREEPTFTAGWLGFRCVKDGE